MLSISSLLERAAESSPEALALLAPGRRPVTYRQLWAHVQQVAAALRTLGIGREDRVAVVLPDGPDMAAMFLAVSATAIIVPLNPGYRTHEYELYFSELKVKALIVQAGEDSKAAQVARPRGIRVINLLPQLDAPAGVFLLEGILYAEATPMAPREASDVALILRTSGTTSRAKIVPLTHANLLSSARNRVTSLQLTADDRCLCILPLYHSASLSGVLLASVASRSSVVCTPGFHALRFLEWFEEFRPTWYSAVPAMHRAILERVAEHKEGLAGSRLRFVRSGSAPLPPKLMADLETALGVPVLETYASTEAGQITINPLPPGVRKVRSVGLPAGCGVAIMDEHGSLMPVGQNGEVVIRGDNVMHGYENDPEANAQSFAGEWFRTGDQGYLDADGYLFLTGRIKEIINRGGEKISPREVDEVLTTHPAVAQAVTFGIPDKKLGEEVGAAVVLREGMEVGEMEMREFAARHIANFKVPRRIMFVQEIPKGPTGKPQRIGMAAKLGLTEANPAQPRLPFTPPRTRTEERLTEVWRQVLRVESVSMYDDFFGVGGDSILAVEFCSRVEAALGRKLTFESLFKNFTLASLAAWLDSGENESPSTALPLIQPSAKSGEVPLSYAQRQFWFLDKFEVGGANFIRLNAYHLHGPLDIDLLRQSLNHIVARHEILRTTYHERDGLPVQMVREAREVALALFDLSTIPEPQRLPAVHGLARKEAWARFDLSADLMLRASLVKLTQDEHILFLTKHHIASDGWSARLILRELAELYSAKLAGRAPVLPALPIQYADFAVFQQQCFEWGLLDQQIEYWKKRLADAPELLTLPIDRPRPNRQTYQGGMESTVLPKEFGTALKDVGIEHRSTLYMVLLAAFQVLLHRYTGEDDLVVGSPIAGRMNAQTESLVGLFSNILPMRASLKGDPTFREFLARTRESALGAQANQDVPVERLIEQLSRNRSARHPALFQVLFQLRNLGAESVVLGPVGLEPFDFDAGTGQFDLYLDIRERAEGLYCELNYNSDLYDGATARRILRHFQTLLEAIAQNAGERISQLNILPEEERRRMLIDWNQTAADHPRQATIHELIEARAQSTPEAIALVFRNEQITYRALNRRANGWAHYLRDCGVTRGVLVGISLERSPLMAVAVLAVLKAGGAYVPLDPEYPKQRLTAMLEDARCPLLITTSVQAQEFPLAGAEVLCIDREVAPSDLSPAADSQAGDCAYVIFTSGSTGKPNGVLIEHRSLVNNSSFFANYIGLRADDRVLQFNSLSFDTAAEEIFPCWLSGATLVFWPEPKAPSIAEFIEFVERERITLVDLPTAYWHEWVSELSSGGSPFPSRLRAVVIGGEKASAPKLAAWNEAVGGRVRLCNTYGPTEATITSTTYDPIPSDTVTDPIPIGRPIANATLYILDRFLQPVPIGVPGELYIGGAGIARGYLNRPELTDQRFIANPFRDAPDPRLYKTGDRARYLADGTVEFLGRNDDQVKWRGFRIELGELENVLARHPHVRAAAASFREEAAEQFGLVAYVVPNHSPPPTPEQLRSFLKEQLPDYMLPSQYVFLEVLPLTPSGKVDRRALPQPARLQRLPRAGSESPRTDLERQIASIWSDVLQTDGIGVDDNFFELGGHSLKVVQVLSRLRNALHVDVPLRRIFEGPTVAEMAVAVLEALAEGLESSEISGIFEEIGATSDSTAPDRRRAHEPPLWNQNG